jgi:ABC-type transport system involved in cytochrome c biogenesis ATPase subunit
MLLAHFNKLASSSAALWLLDAVLTAMMKQQTTIAQHSHSTQYAAKWLIALLNLGSLSAVKDS